MSSFWSRSSTDRRPGNRPGRIPRSTFLRWLGVGVGAVVGGASAVAGEAWSSLPALASFRRRASISFTMPVASKIGLFLGSAATLKPNQALGYTDPKTGDPAILIRLATGKLVSYDIACPHLGCTVPYDPTRQRLVCPCHGAQFDPARGAAPLSGPVSQPLFALPIRVDTSGNVYALDARPGSKINRLHAPPTPSAGDDGNGDGGDGNDDTARRARGTGRGHSPSRGGDG